MRNNICLLAILGVAPALIAANPIPQSPSVPVGIYDYSIGTRKGESMCG